jgi:hypothetical protein
MLYVENISRLTINDIDYTPYREHPRMVELHIFTLYLGLVKEYGVYKSDSLLKHLCEVLAVDWSKIQGIIRNFDKFNEQKKRDTLRFRQEILFLGTLWGHHRVYTARTWLHISHTTMYRFKELLNPEKYITEEWLNGLNNNVIICGLEVFKNEGIRFIEGFFNLVKVLGNVSVSKIRI